MLTYQDFLDMAKRHKHEGVEGVPSCSSADRLVECPGSWAASQGLPNRSSEDALMGTVQHYMQELGYCPDDAPASVQRGFIVTKAIVDRIMEEYGVVPHSRESYHKCSDLTGSMDLVLINDDIASLVIILDFKFGYMAVDPRTRQLGGYAYFAHAGGIMQRHPKKVLVGVVGPNFRGGQDLVEWTLEECREMVHELNDAKKKTDVFNPSWKSCRYCPAMMTSRCPATKNNFSSFVTKNNV